MNGGRCIGALQASHIWVVNNTCFMNGLDSRLGQVGEIQTYETDDVHVINNVAVAWTARYPFKVEESTNVTFSHNVGFGGLPSIVPGEIRANAAALRRVDPRFLSPPQVDPTVEGQWTKAPSVSSVGGLFRPSPGSPLRTAGADPRNEPGVTLEYRRAFDRILSRDLAGTPRCTCESFSVGAFHS
jgi:hypothetical protein